MANTQEETTLRDLCLTACKKHPDPEAAERAVLRMLDHDEALKAMLAETMIRTAIRTTIYQVRASVRADVKQQACDRGIEAITAAAGTIVRSFLRSFTMPNGKTLGDTTGKELDECREQARSAASGWQNRAAFFGVLRQRVGDDETVGAKVNDQQAEEMWAQVERGQPGRVITHSDRAASPARKLARVRNGRKLAAAA